MNINFILFNYYLHMKQKIEILNLKKKKEVIHNKRIKLNIVYIFIKMGVKLNNNNNNNTQKKVLFY